MNLYLTLSLSTILCCFLHPWVSSATNILGAHFCLIYVQWVCEIVVLGKSYQDWESKTSTIRTDKIWAQEQIPRMESLWKWDTLFPLLLTKAKFWTTKIKAFILARQHFTHLKSSFLINSTMISFSGWIWSIFNVKHRKGVGFMLPP